MPASQPLEKKQREEEEEKVFEAHEGLFVLVCIYRGCMYIIKYTETELNGMNTLYSLY